MKKNCNTEIETITGNYRLFNALKEAGLVAYCRSCEFPESCCVYHTIYVEISCASEMNKFIELQKKFKGEHIAHRMKMQLREYMNFCNDNPSRKICREEVVYEDLMKLMGAAASIYVSMQENDC